MKILEVASLLARTFDLNLNVVKIFEICYYNWNIRYLRIKYNINEIVFTGDYIKLKAFSATPLKKTCVISAVPQ